MLAPVDHFRIAARRAGGFTLLEVLLAVAVLVVLVAGLAGVSATSLRLGRRVIDAQQEESTRDAFERILRENLSEIAADSPVRLVIDGTSGGQTLVLGSSSGVFPIADMPLVTDSLALESRRDRSGKLALSLLFYAGDYWQALQDGVVQEEAAIQVPLRAGFDKLEWQVYDPIEDEWLTEWDQAGRRPHYLELLYRFSGDPADSRMIVWLPRIQANVAAAGRAGAGGAGGGAGGEGGVGPRPPQGGQPGGRPSINIPGPPGGPGRRDARGGGRDSRGPGRGGP
jgi:prepilin-type N-terminal cleavage/methylation domain-containing protein